MFDLATLFVGGGSDAILRELGLTQHDVEPFYRGGVV
jgi:hypothetical protein